MLPLLFSLEILLDTSRKKMHSCCFFFFFSQKDTVVALKALSEFSALVHKENTDIQLTVTGPGIPRSIHFRIDSQNLFLLHQEEVKTGVVV